MREEFPNEMEVIDRLAEWLEGRGYSKIDDTVPCCPQQISGRAPNGWPFYYRHRHGEGYLFTDGTVRDVDELIEKHLSARSEPAITVKWSAPEHDGWVPFELAVKRFEEMERMLHE